MSNLLSVIVPTFRRGESLPRLLHALSQQDYENLEVIVVDQNPDPSMPEWFRLYSDVLRLRRVCLSEPNASLARNLGYHVSIGDVLLFMDDDLLPEADFCRRGVEVLSQHANKVECMCPTIVVDGRVTGTEHIIDGTRLGASSLVQLRNSITAAVFFTRDFFGRTGGFDELLFRFARTAEDQELFFRMNRRKLAYWLDESLRVIHDESSPGGCELRTNPYWTTREKCIRSWVIRHRMHGRRGGRLGLSDIVTLACSAFLNRRVLFGGLEGIRRNVVLLLAAIRESWDVLQPHLKRYASLNAVNHLEEFVDSV